MSTTDTTPLDYTTGSPRHHHRLYLEDGNFVMQVENAIFKTHRSILANYSSVIKDMLEVPQGRGFAEGTDEHPLVLNGDNVASWEQLLGIQYDSPAFLNPQVFSRERALTILPIAHKYCREAVEAAILNQLKHALTTTEYVDLMVAAQITGSEPLHKQALDALIACDDKPNVTQAKVIGVEAIHAILTATILSAMSIKIANADNRKCRFCPYQNNWKCPGCRTYQDQ